MNDRAGATRPTVPGDPGNRGKPGDEPPRGAVWPPELAGTVAADYFDGRSARASRVKVAIRGDQLRIVGDGLMLHVPLTDVRWPERQRHGGQVVTLAQGGSLHAIDGQGWQVLRRMTGGESLVVRAQQSWRGVALATVTLLAVLIAGWLWGVPLAARTLVGFVPPEADQLIDRQMVRSMEQQMFGPSRLPDPEQQAIRDALATAVRAAWPRGGAPPYDLRFVDGRRVGANALALPGGTIFVTDQLVALAKRPGADAADPQAMLVGVLGHELGHVERRHGMRATAQVLLIGMVAAAMLGDLNTLLAGVPVVLVQNGYSRDFEREADHDSARILTAAGHSPAVMASFFERLRSERQGESDDDTSLIGIGLASHPADAERIAFFRNAAR